MSKIAKPSHDIDHPDRQVDCQSAIDTHLRLFVSQCVSAGWSECEVLAAVAELADNQMLEFAGAALSIPMLDTVQLRSH